MKSLNKSASHDELTSAELGNLWAVYYGNTLSRCVLQYFLRHVDDAEVEQIVAHALQLTDQFIDGVKQIFEQDQIPLPVGFTKDDVNLDAPRLFLDEYYLHYLQYAGKAGTSIYGVAAPLMLRKDVREFFANCVTSTLHLSSKINDFLIANGMMVKPPYIPMPKKADFEKSPSYFRGFLGSVRPLQSLEITHIYDNLLNNATSHSILTGFSQVAKLKQTKEYLMKGVGITNGHKDTFNELLHRDDLSISVNFDHLITRSTTAPFSDKLMIAHNRDMFSMRIRNYGNSMAVSGRHDIAAMYARLILEVGTHAERGARIMMDHDWMEVPPQAAHDHSLVTQ